MRQFLGVFFIVALNFISAQEYFEFRASDYLLSPAYSEYFSGNELASPKAFLGTYNGEIIQFTPNKDSLVTDTLIRNAAYIKCFDYQVFSKTKELLIMCDADHHLLIFDLQKRKIIKEYTTQYLVNDIKFSNLEEGIAYGGDKRGNIVKINWLNNTVEYFPTHQKGIARLQLFLDKIITSSYDKTIKITEQFSFNVGQTIALEQPILEFDVSIDGIIAFSGGSGYAAYSIIDQKWLFGKEHLKKVVRNKDLGYKLKSPWNPITFYESGSSDYELGGSQQGAQFIGGTHNLVLRSGYFTEGYGGFAFAHLRNANRITSFYFTEYFNKSLFYQLKQDNHLTFYNSSASDYQLKEENYIKSIHPSKGIVYAGNPFSEVVMNQLPFKAELLGTAKDFLNEYPENEKLDCAFIDERDFIQDTLFLDEYGMSVFSLNPIIYAPTEKYNGEEFLNVMLEQMNNHPYLIKNYNILLDAYEESATGNKIELTALLGGVLFQPKYSGPWINTEDIDLIHGDNKRLDYEKRAKLLERIFLSTVEYRKGFVNDFSIRDSIMIPAHVKSYAIHADTAFSRVPQTGHFSKITSFAVSPDLKYLATAGSENNIIIWDFYSGFKIKTLDQAAILGWKETWLTQEYEYDYAIEDMVFHPNQPWLIVSTYNHKIFVWDLQKNKLLGKVEHVQSDFLQLSLNGDYLVTDGELLPLPDLTLEYTPEPYSSEIVEYFNGEYPYLIGSKNFVRNFALGEYSQLMDYYPSRENPHKIERLYQPQGIDPDWIDVADQGILSPDEQWYACDSMLYNLFTDECWYLEGYRHNYEETPIYKKGSFSPDSNYFAFIAGKQLKIFNLNTFEFRVIEDSLVSKFSWPVKFTADSRYVLANAWAIQGGELNWLEEANSNRSIAIYEVKDGSRFKIHSGHPVEPIFAGVSRDQKTISLYRSDFLFTVNLEDLTINHLQLSQDSKRYNRQFFDVKFSENSGGKIEGLMEKNYSNNQVLIRFEWNLETQEFTKYPSGQGYSYDDGSFFCLIGEVGYEREQQPKWLDLYEELIGFQSRFDTTLKVMLDTARFHKLISDEYYRSVRVSGSFSYSYFPGNIKALAVDSALQTLYLPTSSHGIAKYSLPDLKKLEEWEAHTEHIIQLLVIGNKLLSVGNEGEVILWNTESNDGNREICRFYLDRDGIFVITPDNYYSANKDNLDFIGFRKGTTFLPMQSFDLKYNRPDIVLKRLGSSDSATISIYEKAYKKRLKRMGISANELHIENLPLLEIEDFEHLPKFTKDTSITVQIKAKQGLKNALVWLNGVPINTCRMSKNREGLSITIPLISGVNEIEIQGITDNNSKTIPQVYKVVKDGNTESNLYTLSIGVSQYKDETYNLDYAAKDAADVSELFSNLNGFDSTYSLLIQDKAVTFENVNKIESFLSQSKRNDVIIIYLAGHGILDNELNYYYGSHDIDFNHPQQKGWSYEFIEGMLAQSKAIKKLLLFDTCHGGEIDKDELVEEENENTGEELAFRATKSFTYSINQSDASKVSKTFFQDFRKGVGATIIASSGGTEYALESDTYKNGVFTYFLIQGLTENRADLNNDRRITVNELRNYLNIEVAKATKGKQNPGTRILNDKTDLVLKFY